MTEVLSPLVDIRSRLVNRTNTLLFRVSSPVKSNWRYIALPEFDGRTFRLPDEASALEEAGGSFGTVRPGAETFIHEIQIQSLGGQLRAGRGRSGRGLAIGLAAVQRRLVDAPQARRRARAR